MYIFVLRRIGLSTFSHDPVRILVPQGLTAGGAPNSKTGQLLSL